MIEKIQKHGQNSKEKNWTDFCVGYIAKWVGISQKNKLIKKNTKRMRSLFSVAIVENVESNWPED